MVHLQSNWRVQDVLYCGLNTVWDQKDVGKCVSVHTCVMLCSNQVLEASFHCVTYWHHPGLLALPSAAVKHSHRWPFSRSASTGLVKSSVYDSCVFYQYNSSPDSTELSCWGLTLFIKEAEALLLSLTWLPTCDSRGEKQQWRGSSVTNILFLTHNLLQNHTSKSWYMMHTMFIASAQAPELFFTRTSR